MTILHIITRLILGGAQQNTVLTCAAQVAAGHRVVLAYGPIYGPEGSMLDDARATGAELIEVRGLRRAVAPLRDYLCLRRLRKLIRRIQPDVVHTHSSKAGILGRAAAWPAGVPAVVHTIHGLPFHDCQRRQLYRSYVAAERWAATRCHRLIGITQAMCDAFAAEGIGRPEQFAVVPSGVDTSQFTVQPGQREATRRELDIPLDAPVVGLVSRIDPLKGHADLLKCLPFLLDRHRNLRIVFVGDGWARRDIEQRVRDLRLTRRVTFTGLVPMPRMPAMYAAMDVAVLPSYQEGLGRTLVEALLCGCAIVGYDTGGIGEVCIDGETGRLVPCGDIAALGEAIGWMLSHEDERRAMAERGRRHAAEHFSIEAMVRGLEQVYRELLEQQK